MNDEEKKYNERVKIIVAILVTIVITICVTVLVYDKYLSKKGLLINSYESSKDVSDSLDELKTILESTYKGELNDEEMKQAALKGYVEGVGDDYTEYLTKKEWEDLETSLSDFVGIGVYLGEMKTSKETVVIGTIGEESPAAIVGIKSGDIVKAVNSEDVSDKGVEYVASKVKGPEGSTVKVTVLRENEELTFDITRKSIKVYEIKSEILSGNIGYIDFDSFTETSYQEFKSAYDNLKSKGAKSLIIDLRDNTGGYVNSALNIADLFVDKDKTLLITEDKDGKRVTNYSQHAKEITMPVVVLVNDYSASASEILTGILKDYKIATIVGIKTYGKGVIQNVYPHVLDGALKVTTAEYFTPNGNKIHKIGIEPDEEVKLDENATSITKENDLQLQKAIEILKK
ncbi:MAG: S41 family peptidase [Clostridia bacterium]|nr:S41 family peptidase [Clostridia bacterium]